MEQKDLISYQIIIFKILSFWFNFIQKWELNLYFFAHFLSDDLFFKALGLENFSFLRFSRSFVVQKKH